MTRYLVALPIVLMMAAPLPAGDSPLDLASEAYLDEYYAVHPVRATQLGVHDHDGKLPDLSRAALKAHSRCLVANGSSKQRRRR